MFGEKKFTFFAVKELYAGCGELYSAETDEFVPCCILKSYCSFLMKFNECGIAVHLNDDYVFFFRTSR